MFSVILHTLDNGALLSVTESVGYRRVSDASRHAEACASQYATRYQGATVRKLVGPRWVISDARGYSFAQFDVTP